MLDTPFGFTRGQAIKATIALEGALLAAGVVLAAGSKAAETLLGTTPWWFDGTSPGLMGLTNLAAFAFILSEFLRRNQTPWRELLAWRPASPGVYACLLVALVGLAIVESEADNLLQWLLPVPEFIVKTFAPLHDLSRYPLGAPLTLMVIAPLTEELFFRGFILRRLLASVPAWTAIWTSALLFMAFHLNPWQFPVALLTGLLFGWVYARTRSIGLCLAAHAFVNGSSLLVSGLPFSIRGFNAPHERGIFQHQPWWFDLAGLAILGAGWYLLSRHTPPLPPAPVPMELPPLLVPETGMNHRGTELTEKG